MSGRRRSSREESSRLSRLVAKNGAVVTIGTDRRVASDEAEFDAKADTALFTGNVVVNQQKNVLQGQAPVRRPQDRQEPAGDAGRGRPAGRPHRRDLLSEATARPRPATQAQVADRRWRSRPSRAACSARFKTDPNAPIDVEADTLDVHDQAKQAIFRGKVKSQQGDFIVRTVEMTVFYTGQSGFGLTSGGEDAAGKAPSQITRWRRGRRC